MAITEEQRIKRRSFIGSSDVAAICNVDPFRNAGDVWLEKTGRLESDTSSRAADLGTDMEGAILNMFERRMSVLTARDIFLSNTLEDFPACANLDGAIPERTVYEERPGFFAAVVEAKSTSLLEEWGERDGDVPLRVLTQTHWQMWIASCRLAWVPVLFPDFGRFRLEVYRVERDDALVEELRYRARKFWLQNVLADRAPAEHTPHLETLKRMRRAPASVTTLDDEAVALWAAHQQATAERLRLEKEIEGLKARLLAKLGDSEAGQLPDGQLITYLEQAGVRSCDWSVLEAELRGMGRFDLFERLVKQARFRVLRCKKAE